MKKTTITLLLAVVCCYSTIQGQQLARWDLTNNPVVSYQSTHVNAGKLTEGNGVFPASFSPNGAYTSAWETSSDVSGEDYYEICVKPKPGYLLDVNNLSFTEMRTAEGIRAYRLKWSLDGFNTYTVLDDVALPDDVNPRSLIHPNLDIRVCDGQELCIRWYGYATEAYEGEWYLSDVAITGTEAPACTPPDTPPTNLTASNIGANTMDVSWSAAGTDATLVLARAGAPVEFTICGGQPYTADAQFGQGASLGHGTFVVYNGAGTNFTLSGLEDGTTYYLTALGYNTPEGCYQDTGLPQASGATLCGAPSAVDALRNSPSDEQMALAWNIPPCYDEVMIVASTQPINSMPADDASAYLADPNFTPLGAPSGGLATGEGVVYRGTDTYTEVSGLTNDQDYFFKIYTFRDGAWTAGAEVMKAPMAGCNFLGGDFVYISELHFNNKNTDIDKGIEVAGRAGIDLSNYVLAIYDNRSYLERIIPLSGTIDDEGQGYGAVWVPDPELFSASAIALVNTVTGVTTDFVAHRVFGVVAYDGPAEGQPAFSQGRNEDPNTPVNYSIQRQGDIACPNTSLEWTGPAPATRGELNFAQSMFPITLLSFDGQLQDESVLLRWATESEENNDYMAVEHSTDARRYAEVGRVKGAGTTVVPQSYRLWHYGPRPGINYYRLRQVDFDGTTTYHGPVAVTYKGEGVGIEVFPRLASEEVVVRLSTPAEQDGELLVYDIGGRPVKRWATASGFIRQNLDVSTLPPGHYFLEWRPAHGEIFKDRFVKL